MADLNAEFWSDLNKTLQEALKPSDDKDDDDTSEKDKDDKKDDDADPNATANKSDKDDKKDDVDVKALAEKVDAVEKSLSADGDIAKAVGALKDTVTTIGEALEKVLDRVGNLEKATAVRKSIEGADEGEDDDDKTKLSKAVRRLAAQPGNATLVLN